MRVGRLRIELRITRRLQPGRIRLDIGPQRRLVILDGHVVGEAVFAGDRDLTKFGLPAFAQPLRHSSARILPVTPSTRITRMREWWSVKYTEHGVAVPAGVTVLGGYAGFGAPDPDGRRPERQRARARPLDEFAALHGFSSSSCARWPGARG